MSLSNKNDAIRLDIANLNLKYSCKPDFLTLMYRLSSGNFEVKRYIEAGLGGGGTIIYEAQHTLRVLVNLATAIGLFSSNFIDPIGPMCCSFRKN